MKKQHIAELFLKNPGMARQRRQMMNIARMYLNTWNLELTGN